MQDLRNEKHETDSPAFDGQSEGRQTHKAPDPRGYEPDRLPGHARDNPAQRGEVSCVGVPKGPPPLEAAERS